MQCLLLNCRVGEWDTVVINYTGKVLTACKEKVPHAVVKSNNRFPRKVMKAALLEIFETQLYRLGQ